MQRVQVIAAAVFLGASIASPAALDCVPDTLAGYVTLGSDGCRLGSYVASEFDLIQLTAGSDPLPPEMIFVNPVEGPLGTGFRFTVDATAGPAQVFESLFGFLIAVDTGGPIGAASLDAAGASAAGDGVTLAIADLCSAEIPEPACSNSIGSLTTFALKGAAQSMDHLAFPGVIQIGVRQDIVLDGGFAGAASLGSLILEFQQVPEPATFLLLAAGMVALGVLRRN